MPACQPRIARRCSNVTGSSSFADSGPDDGPGAQLAQIRAQIDGRFWLHLGQGWRFFAPEQLHHPPDRGARGRTRGVPGGDQLRRRGQIHRRQRGRAGGAPGTRCRPLRPHRGGRRAARRCSTPHAWIGRAVSMAPTGIRSRSLAGGRPLPGCGPPASTRCSASQESDPAGDGQPCAAAIPSGTRHGHCVDPDVPRCTLNRASPHGSASDLGRHLSGLQLRVPWPTR